MNLNVSKFLIGFIIIGIFVGCTQDEINVPSSNDSSDYIKYGSDFSMCYGYCFRELTISESKIDFEKKSHFSDKKYPDFIKSEINTSEAWNKLLSKINLKEFNNLDTIIGCPDCADGGAEWIEIKKGGIRHKVAFEYKEEPEIVKEFVRDLRAIMAMIDLQYYE